MSWPAQLLKILIQHRMIRLKKLKINVNYYL